MSVATFVPELRERRLRGAGGAELGHFLENFGFSAYDARDYLKEAVCLKSIPNVYLLMRDSQDRILDSA